MEIERETVASGNSAAENLTSAVGKNTIFGMIASLFQVGTRLVTVPIVIYHLGLGGYGIWSIIMTAAIYMRFGSAGVKSAFQKYVAEATGDGSYERASQLLSTGTATMALVSAVGLVPVIIYSKQLASAAGVPPEFLTDAARAFTAFAVTMLFANSGAAYEAIVLGGHRIDLARKANCVLTATEAVAIVALLHFGFGLFAMACVMATSELLYLVYCYAVAHSVVAQVHVAVRYLSRAAIRELVRFVGSYQLLNMLQITYAAVVPILLLRTYGADSAGVYAVAGRLAWPVSMCHNAFLLPILSSSAMVYATGESERLRRVLAKSFKVTLAITLTPLALISIFGTDMVQAWTGRTDPAFHFVIWLLCVVVLLQAFSTMALVLYRAAGGAVMDNVFQAMRLVAFVPVLFMARHAGFEGILEWMAASEFAGVVLMFIALERTFHVFKAKMLLPDALRLFVATGTIVAFSMLAVHSVPSFGSTGRMLAAYKIGMVCLAAAVAGFPALYLTGSFSGAEFRSVLGIFRRGRAAGLPSFE
jgi:O-antigen/teichoic acid export membrane protein